MKKVAIYIRVSSDEAKKEGYSPQTQEEKLREFIIANNYELNKKHIYTDLGYSGGTDKRPEFQRLLKDTKNKEFDMILVYRQDRFFRNLRLLLNTVGDLKELGIEFKSLTEPFDTTTPTGRAMFANAGVFAEWQREIGLEARNEGMIKAMKEGKWLGGTPPFGYRFNRKTQQLEIDKKEAKVVRMIFNWLIYEKLSRYKIQERLNAKEIPTKWARLKRVKKVNGSAWWNIRTVGRILKNEIYTGEFYYRKYKYLQSTRKELRPREEWIKIKIPAILSKELYEKTQRQFKKNQTFSYRKTKRLYALQHKLFCGLDGFPYHVRYRAPREHQRKEAKVYFCGGKTKFTHSKLCPAPYITESRLLPVVWGNLQKLLINPEITINSLQEYHSQKSKQKALEVELKQIDKNLLSCQQKKEKILNLYLEDYINEKVYKNKLEELKQKEIKIQEEKERLSNLLINEQDKKNRIISIQELYKSLKNSLNNATYEVQCQILKKIVERVKVTGDALEIEYNLPLKVINPVLEFYGDNRRMD